MATRTHADHEDALQGFRTPAHSRSSSRHGPAGFGSAPSVAGGWTGHGNQTGPLKLAEAAGIIFRHLMQSLRRHMKAERQRGLDRDEQSKTGHIEGVSAGNECLARQTAKLVEPDQRHVDFRATCPEMRSGLRLTRRRHPLCCCGGVERDQDSGVRRLRSCPSRRPRLDTGAVVPAAHDTETRAARH